MLITIHWKGSHHIILFTNDILIIYYLFIQASYLYILIKKAIKLTNVCNCLSVFTYIFIMISIPSSTSYYILRLQTFNRLIYIKYYKHNLFARIIIITNIPLPYIWFFHLVTTSFLKPLITFFLSINGLNTNAAWTRIKEMLIHKW